MSTWEWIVFLNKEFHLEREREIMAHHRHRDASDDWVFAAGIFVGIPLGVSVFLVLIALCYAIVWHIGRWVSWW